MPLPKLIDNVRVTLADTLRKIANSHDCLSIATGYWDLPGTVEILKEIKDYKSIRLLIGKEPLAYKYKKALSSAFKAIDSEFPHNDISSDLERFGKGTDAELLRAAVIELCKMISEGRLEVRVFKKTTLHAKAYIFGTKDDSNSVGVVGSSNFTKAGLTTNTELNALEEDYRVINWTPTNDSQENGYLSWFDSLWNDESVEKWTGEFSQIIQDSPVGNMCFGPYDTYIKTLMEVYPDEMSIPEELEKKTSDILYSFQNRNAGILINKLAKTGLAILSDSVGLGKTITAGAVVQHYLTKTNGKANILIIAPAGLKQQWKDDLASILGIDYMDGAYQIVSQQDIHAIEEIYGQYKKEWRRTKNIDLFVIDEAHNLRNSSGTRHDAILNLLQQHPDSHILLLTATPINNSLLDIANIIQLASKGKMSSVSVSYPRPDGKPAEMIDFFDAVKRVQRQIKQAENKGESVEDLLERYKPTIHDGLRHYLVRSTRQGVEAEGGIIDSNNNRKTFPKSDVTSITYKYDDSIVNKVFDEIGRHVQDCFEGLDPRKFNLDLLSEFTQQTKHPLDFLNDGLMDENKIITEFDLEENVFSGLGHLYRDDSLKSLVPNLLQIAFTLGFTPYRPDVYQHKFYGKTIEEIQALKDIPANLGIQLTVHNVLQITWLKRMESSAAALLYSINNYSKRIALFEKYLDKGFIVNLLDASLLETDYNNGEDIDKAFDDYDAYLEEREKLLLSGKNADELKKYGVERKMADPKIYNLKQIRNDLTREKRIIGLLNEILADIIKPENDMKAKVLHDEIQNVLSSGKYGKKVLVFSFFADTIKYLQENSQFLFGDIDPKFPEHSGFVSGQTGSVESTVRRFSPLSKHYSLQDGEEEIDFLFSTDVLSEGQNLQDAGYLINYDLHWNPVRMIQRNGRINRLGSTYDNVLISNMRPSDELEMYLKLVNRLERKIKTIRNTIGLDQGILDSSDVNPIEFIEKYYSTGELPDEDSGILAHTDEHVLELRKFLGKNKENPKLIEYIKRMPIGKWNYLPSASSFKNCSLALVKAVGTTEASKHNVSELFFVDIKQTSEEYIATYIDTVKALDSIRTDETDNERLLDKIKLDRVKISNRSMAEAKRQAANPENSYSLEPQYEKALLLIASSFDKRIDFKGIIEHGVNTINAKAKLEEILRKAKREYSDTGSVHSSTIIDFTKLFNQIQEEVSEGRVIESTEGVLFYARKY